MRFPPRGSLVALGISALGMLTTACQSAADLTALRSEVIVEAPGAKLTGADLERWLMASPEMPTAISARFLTSTWIDQALFAEALRQGVAFSDSAVVDSLIWNDAAMLAVGNFFTVRAATGARVSDAQADSLFARGEVKVFQRLKLAVTPEGDTVARTRAESRAEALRTRAVAGEDFSKLVRENTDDPRDKASAGLLPAVTRDSLPSDQMYGHLWTLRPGDFSRVFSNDVAALFFSRPQAEIARPFMKGYLFPLLQRRADSLFVDSLSVAKQVTLAKGAVDRLRALAAEPITVSSADPLATWSGGQIDETVVRRWLIVMDPNRRAEVEQMSDQTAEKYLRELAQRHLLLEFSGSPVITPAVRAGLGSRMAQSIEDLRKVFVSATGAPPSAAVPTTLIDSLTIGLQAYQPIPSGLAGFLRARFQFTINAAARDQLLEAVQVKYAEAHAGDTKAKGNTP